MESHSEFRISLKNNNTASGRFKKYFYLIVQIEPNEVGSLNLASFANRYVSFFENFRQIQQYHTTTLTPNMDYLFVFGNAGKMAGS